jgi:hypothetical protein
MAKEKVIGIISKQITPFSGAAQNHNPVQGGKVEHFYT